MVCSGCASSMSDDCRYCPQCGQPTLLTAPTESAAVQSESDSRSLREDRGVALTRYIPSTSLTTSLPESLQSALTQANLCRVRREWEAAIDYCVEVLRIQPGNQSAHALLGDIYRDQNKLDDAIQWYRMAVDLRPNPTDEAKLHRLEQERLRQLQGSDARFGGPGLAVALNADGSVKGGTVNLMGVSPRRWLTGLTLVSVTFATLMICVLVGMKYSRRSQTPASSGPSASLPVPRPSASSSPLPSPSFASAAGVPSLPDKVSALPSAGSGFAPDEGSLPNLSGPAKTSANSLLPGLSKESAPAPRDLPPAPVLAVKPLPAPPESKQEPAQEANPRPVITREERGSITLAEGMRLTKTHRAADGSVSLLIASPISSVAALNPGVRAAMVRNVYRAGRAFFAANANDARLSVYVQADTEGARGGPTLLIAEVDRNAAFLHNPDIDPLERLEAGLLSLRYAGETQKAESKTPSYGHITVSAGDA